MKKIFSKITVKWIALLSAAALLAGICTSCGQTSDKDNQGRTVISVGAWPQQDGEAKTNMEERKEMFEEANPDVVIQPDTWQFELKTFYAKAAGGQLPTVYTTHFTEVRQIIDSGYSADLTDVLHNRGYDGKFNEQILEIVSKDGRIYAFPFSAYVLGLGYNTELFEQAGLMEADGTPMQPKDWDEVVEFAVKIKEATGKPGFVFPTANNNGGWLFTCLAWSFGTEFMRQDENGKWQATFNSPEAAAALSYIKDLKWKYDVLPQNTLIDGTEYYKTFATGNAGMLITAGDIPRKLTQYDMQPEQVGIMALPAGPQRHVTLLGGSIFALAPNATEAQIDAGIRWLETAYTSEATEEFKVNKKNELDKSLADNELIGIKLMRPWSQDSEAVKYEYDLIDQYANANPNHVRLYNEFVADLGDCELQAEEPVCAQELYGVLDSCIQEVLVNPDADCVALLEKANSDFQVNYLDSLDY